MHSTFLERTNKLSNRYGSSRNRMVVGDRIFSCFFMKATRNLYCSTVNLGLPYRLVIPTKERFLTLRCEVRFINFNILKSMRSSSLAVDERDGSTLFQLDRWFRIRPLIFSLIWLIINVVGRIRFVRKRMMNIEQRGIMRKRAMVIGRRVIRCTVIVRFCCV